MSSMQWEKLSLWIGWLVALCGLDDYQSSSLWRASSGTCSPPSRKPSAAQVDHCAFEVTPIRTLPWWHKTRIDEDPKDWWSYFSSIFNAYWTWVLTECWCAELRRVLTAVFCPTDSKRCTNGKCHCFCAWMKVAWSCKRWQGGRTWRYCSNRLEKWYRY